jgi:hypothetical protein
MSSRSNRKLIKCVIIGLLVLTFGCLTYYVIIKNKEKTSLTLESQPSDYVIIKEDIRTPYPTSKNELISSELSRFFEIIEQDNKKYYYDGTSYIIDEKCAIFEQKNDSEELVKITYPKIVKSKIIENNIYTLYPELFMSYN